MKIVRKIFRFIFKALKWTFLFILLLAVVSALYNLTLPDRSEVTAILSEKEKACIAETMNLLHVMGNEVWPGWGEVHIPIIVYNEEFAFLVGYPNPPAGWKKMPAETFRGGEWEPVPDDHFFGSVYYRQPLPDPDVHPENFTVKVGEQWVATMQTREYAGVAFYKGFKEELPPLLNAVFPYKIFWSLLMGRAENYIGGLTHEAFHAFQGSVTPLRFAQAESASGLSGEYPWHQPENATGWEEETNLLMKAYHTSNMDSMHHLISLFVEKREERRKKSQLPEPMIQYEKNREWLEGLAKYAELKSGLLAGESNSYQPVETAGSIGGFKSYTTRKNHVNQQVAEVKRAAKREGETRFYYGGMLQAMMLDRLMPHWKNEVFSENIYLDDLLEKAVENL
jgi:hypothetical protein